MATESRLWQEINALGGVPANEYDTGYNDAVKDVLAIIERGGWGLGRGRPANGFDKKAYDRERMKRIRAERLT